MVLGERARAGRHVQLTFQFLLNCEVDMKMSAISKFAAGLASLAAFSAPAFASLTIVDGWQLTTPATGTDINIGHLVLQGGGSIIQQQTDASGNVYVGAKFAEGGFTFTTSYIKENSPGGGDTGFPSSLDPVNGLKIVFSNVYGAVSDILPGGGFKYTFDGGNFLIQGTDGTSSLGDYASGAIVGIGGVGAATNVIGGVAGSSNLLALVGSIINPGFNVADSSGNSLLSGLLGGSYLFQATTTNTIDLNSGGAFGACIDTTNVTFGAGAQCSTFSATSEGALNVVKVPEPASLALVGVALFAAGVVGRRSARRG